MKQLSGRLIRVLRLLFVLICSLGFFSPVSAAASNLVISEIMYDAAGSDDKHEWVEIFNSGVSPVTIITGSGAGSWRFNDGSNHTFSLSQGLVAVSAGGYAILADDPATFLADYPTFSGTIFKVSMSLNNTQDTLKLSADKGATFFGQVSYSKTLGAAGNGKTLELVGGVFRESYIDGGTPGAAASTPPAPKPAPVYSNDVLIQEVYPNPKTGEDEFIELYNSGRAPVDLSGWQIDDIGTGGSSVYTIPSGTNILAGGYFAFYDKVSLNNDGDWARLIAPDGEVKFQMNYDSTTKGRSWARDASGAFVLTRIVTAGRANEFAPIVQTNDIIINEIIPEPAGDSDDEMIELRNLSQYPIDITDWQLDDIADGGSSFYTFPVNTIIPAGGYYIVYKSTSGISLNNDGDQVRLLWANSTLSSDIVYSKTKIGESYSRRDDGSWEWTAILTPGSPNQFPVPIADQPVISEPKASPLPQSPTADNSQFLVSNFQTPEVPEGHTFIELSIEAPALPPLPPKIAGKNIEFTLSETEKEDTMVPQTTVFTSASIVFFGGIRRWYIRQKMRMKPSR